MSIIKHPNWDLIKELCNFKIDTKYDKYGNSWVDLFDDEFWNKRLMGEVLETQQTSNKFQSDKRIDELVDVINICAMQITNISHKKSYGLTISNKEAQQTFQRLMRNE